VAGSGTHHERDVSPFHTGNEIETRLFGRLPAPKSVFKVRSVPEVGKEHALPARHLRPAQSADRCRGLARP